MKKLTTSQARRIPLDSLKEIEESRQRKADEEAEFTKRIFRDDGKAIRSYWKAVGNYMRMW